MKRPVKKKLNLSDSELVALISSTDQREAEEAFAELYQRYASMVHAYCMRIFNNDEQGEDIFQETFIKFFQSIKVNQNTSNVSGFLITIARNISLNFQRDKQQTVPIEDMDFIDNSNQSYHQTELLDLITRALDLLEFEFHFVHSLKVVF